MLLNKVCQFASALYSLSPNALRDFSQTYHFQKESQVKTIFRYSLKMALVYT